MMQPDRTSRGLSIVELIVVLAIVATLVAITVPTLRSARQQGRDVAVLSAMRSLGMAIQQYGFENNLAYPYLGSPGDPASPHTVLGVDISNAQGSYFQRLGAFWGSVVGPYMTGRPSLDAFPPFTPWRRDGIVYENVVTSRFWMSHTAFALPDYWDPMVVSPSVSLLDGTRTTHVKHPARKGLLLDIASPALLSEPTTDGPASNVIHVLMADGAAVIQQFEPQAPFVRRPYSASPLPIMSTQHGLRGVDF